MLQTAVGNRRKIQVIRRETPVNNPKAATRKGLKKKGKIGSAAAKVFNKKGYLETNIDDATERGGGRFGSSGIY